MYTVYLSNPGKDPEPLKTFVNHLAAIAYAKKIGGAVFVRDEAGYLYYRGV